MSRNGSGVYNLPAGNPVVTGTTISSTWANNTLADMANAITGSIAADGQTTITGPLKGPNGTVSFAGVGQTRIPVGTTAQRAATPLDGMIRYNTDIQQYEGYKNGAWTIFGNGAGGTLFSDTVTATQGQTVITMPTGYVLGGDNLSVYVNGSRQIYNVNYTETTTTSFTFATGLNAGDLVNYTIGASTSLSVNAASVLYNEGSTGAVDTNVEVKLQQYVSVLDFGADPTGVADSSAAIQAAIDSCIAGTGPSNQSGGKIFFPRGSYLVNTPLNLTSTVSVLRAYIQLIGTGNGTIIKANTGDRLFDCVGTNFLMFRDFYVISGADNPSTIIFQLARSTAPYTSGSYNKIENVTVSIKSINAENNGFGTIGLLNVESEDFMAHNFTCSANSPIVLMRQPTAASLLTLTSYAPILGSSISFGQVTFSGKTQMQAWNKWRAPLYIDGVNTCTFENGSWQGGTSPWDSDTTSTWQYAVEVGPTALNTCQFFGLVESHKSFMKVGANIDCSLVNIVVAATTAISSDELINLQDKALVNSKITITNGDAARRPLIIGTGVINASYLSGINISNSLAQTLTVNAINTEYVNDSWLIDYGKSVQKSVISVNPVDISTTTAFKSILLPTVVAGNNNGILTVKLEGVVTTFNVKTQTVPPSVATFTSYIDLVSDLNGTYTVGTPVTTLGTAVSGNAAQANITGLTITAAVVSNTLRLSGLATVAGTNGLDNGVKISGTIEANWRGFSGSEGVSIL